MFSKILVPLDGSPLAEKALLYAAVLARVSGGRVFLVRAIETWAATHREQVEKALERKPQAEAELSSVAGRLTSDGIPTEAWVFAGEAASVIGEAARSHDVDLIAMSTHGRSGLARWAYGSVAERVLRLASRPILLVPAHCERRWEPGKAGTVLVPLDGSPLAEEALDPATALARTLGAGISLLQIIEPPTLVAYDSPGYAYFNLADWAEQAKPYIDNLVDRLRSEARGAEGETLIGYAAATISRQADVKNAAAIVMATHGRSGIARMVLGSVALGVVQRASVPVLLMRPVALT